MHSRLTPGPGCRSRAAPSRASSPRPRAPRPRCWKAGKEEKTKTERKRAPRKLKFSYMEQKEYETIDADIAALEDKIATLETEIAGAATQYTRLTELMAEKEQAEAALEEKAYSR